MSPAGLCFASSASRRLTPNAIYFGSGTARAVRLSRMKRSV
ncbi:hypothetical protein RMSM_06229 [Rhodopirellula maiorica SM1]|uniref:Uncharacterized protein n=1 Tax=Rhodopirellula maiorica SM1 TaxID=1265738 RepID=M5RSB4_9BACT|nr:hypothetical protein RMSM_06229 [Rhodopirellula maiorica SM1]